MNIKNRVRFVFKHKISWLPFALAFIGFVVPMQQANATPTPGLNVTVYNNYGYNGSPPLPTVSGRPVQCTTTYSVIDQNFGGNICGLYDDYIVKYEGYITSPTTQIITFYPSADDGTKLYIDGNLIDNNWFDKGGGGNLSTPVSFTAGVPKPITLWFYENGGGNWVNLAWDQSDSYQTVPADAFTQNDETSYTTTTTTSTTTIPPTTTTTLAPYFNAVQNLTAVANEDGSVFLDWDAPAASNTAPYMYNILFYDLVNGQETSGWGVWTYAANTSYTLGSGMWAGTTGYGPVRFKIQAGTGPCVGEGAGNCLYGPQASVDATVLDPTSTTTSSTSTTTTSTTTTSTTTTTTVPTTTTTSTTTTSSTTTTVFINTTTTSTTPPPVENGSGGSTGPSEPVSEPVDTTPPQESTPEPEQESTPEELPEETLPETQQPETTTPEEPESTESTLPPIIIEPTEPETVEVEDPETTYVDDITLPEEFNNLPEDASAEDIADVIGTFLDTEIPEEQFEAVLDKVFEDISDTEQVTEVLESLLSEDLDKEQLVSVMDAVFSEDASVDQMNAVVDDLLETDLS